MNLFGTELDQTTTTVVTAFGVYLAYRLVDWLLPRGRYFRVVDWYSNRPKNGKPRRRSQDGSEGDETPPG